MGVGTLTICSFLTAAQMVYVFYSFDKHYLKVALGYKAYVDIVYSLGMTIYFALSGTISGIIMSTISGTVLSLSLLACRKLYGYRKLETIGNERKWVEYAPEYTLDGFKTKLGNYLPKVA